MHEKVEELLKQPWFVPAVTGVVSFGGGLGLGFLLGKKKQKTVTVIPNEQLTLDFDIYDNINIDSLAPRSIPPRTVIPAEVIEAKRVAPVKNLSDLRGSFGTDEAVEEDQDEDDEPEITTPEPDPDAEWDYEYEIVNRDSSKPYIISHEEFYADELDFAQHTLTFYAKDEIMVDEDDKPVYNHATVVGELRFGHGSGNEDLVFVRNHKLKAEYEIIRVNALYSQEVLGLEIEDNQRVADLKHSRQHKFRTE